MERLPKNATTEAEVTQYMRTRALQLLSEGYVWCGRLNEKQPGAYTTYFTKDGMQFEAQYVLKQYRGKGIAWKMAESPEHQLITVLDCGVWDFYRATGQNPLLARGMWDTPMYSLISKYYGDRKATRSQVFLMNHIDEGCAILEEIGASVYAKEAFIAHPLVQLDPDLLTNHADVVKAAAHPWVVGLAMEYRSQANAWLSPKIDSHDGTSPTPGPLPEVRDMLIADKIQNYKDFRLHHYGKHPRSDQLDLYFHRWFDALGLNYDEVERLIRSISI